MGKSISRKGAKSQKAQRKQSRCSLRVFAASRLCVTLFVFSQLLLVGMYATQERYIRVPRSRRLAPAYGDLACPAHPLAGADGCLLASAPASGGEKPNHLQLEAGVVLRNVGPSAWTAVGFTGSYFPNTGRRRSEWLRLST